MNDDQQNTVLSKASVFGLLDEAPKTALHYCYWLPASGSYVSEITPRSLRSRMTVATIALQSGGMILAAVVAIAIFRFHPSAPDWLLLLGTGALLAA